MPAQSTHPLVTLCPAADPLLTESCGTDSGLCLPPGGRSELCERALVRSSDQTSGVPGRTNQENHQQTRFLSNSWCLDSLLVLLFQQCVVIERLFPSLDKSRKVRGGYWARGSAGGAVGWTDWREKCSAGTCTWQWHPRGSCRLVTKILRL